MQKSMIILVVTLLITLPASGAVIVYQGSDPAAMTAAEMANSLIAQADFSNAVSNLSVESFEGVAVGSYPALNLGDLSVSATSGLQVRLGYSQGIAVSGSQCAGTSGSRSVVFSFSQPIDAFGGFFSDVGDYGGVLTANFNDGTQQILPMPNTLPGDFGIMFFGFTDFGKKILSVEILNTSTTEWYAFDDIQWQTVPEPATSLMLVFGGLALRLKNKCN